jgi:signal transduction histidine kinase
MTQSASPAETQQGVAPRILVVDDEQYMCDVCSRTLQRGGYSVIATTDPDDAARILRSQSFDLLLTDIKMPTMSGLDLANIARERDPAIAIIIMTGFASMEHLHQSVQRGVADFLSKPFELEHLRLAVDQALHKRAILQDNLRLRSLTQLQSRSEQLNATLELHQLSQLILRITLTQSGARAGFLLLNDTTSIIASPGAQITPIGIELARYAFRGPQPRNGHNEIFALVNGSELRYGLAVPLRAQGEIQGILLLCDECDQVHLPGVIESVMLLGNHAGAALRNAVLYKQLDSAYQRLQELDRLKSEFIAIASHELRTPLSIVLGYGMMIQDQASGDLHEYMQRVMESAQRIKEVVDDMVSLRHLEIGESPPMLEVIVIQDLIGQVIEGLRSMVEQNQHQILLDLPAEPLTLKGDREKILIVLNHLLSNAIKFTPQGGQIRISAEVLSSADIASNGAYHVPKTPDTSGQWLACSFHDNGIGISEREQRRIFDRFYQVSHSLRRDRGGIGLGLALVRELITALGGVVWVRSREGEGSVFAIALPLNV